MFRILVAGVTCFFACVAAAAATPPLEAYGRLPAAAHVTISPDGAHLAMVTGDGPSRQLLIIDLKQGSVVGSTNVSKSKVQSVDWAGPDHLVVISSETSDAPLFGDDKHELYTAIVRDLKRGKWTVLLKDRKDAKPLIFGSTYRNVDGKPTLFLESLNFPDTFQGQSHIALFRYDLNTDAVTIAENGGQHTKGWVLDDQGRPVARTDYDEEKGLWSLWVNNGVHWLESKRLTAKIDQPSTQGLGADGRGVLVREPGEEDAAIWREVTFADGAWSAELTALKGSSALINDRVTFRPIGRIVPDGDDYKYEFASQTEQQAWNRIVHSFPGEILRLVDWTDDHSKAVVYVDGPKHGVGFFLIDMKTLQASIISAEYEGIGVGDLNPVRRFDYAAQDGLALPGYITTPRGRDLKALPLVVLVHGGPEGHDTRAFDWWAQAIASRGYAVFQPQFRGSDGFGQKLLAAGYGEWGRKMQTDVSDGVRALVKQGIVDPKRVCITGASYGGYAALAGAALDPEPYRCAVAVAGVSDVKRMVRFTADDQKFEENSAQRYWLRFMGLKDANDPHAGEISPLAHADRIRMPVLLIHGVDDTTVPYEQSQLMANAMRAAGKPVEFVTLKGEDHHLSRGETRTQMLQAMMKFIEANNPPDAPKADPAKAAAR